MYVYYLCILFIIMCIYIYILFVCVYMCVIWIDMDSLMCISYTYIRSIEMSN